MVNMHFLSLNQQGLEHVILLAVSSQKNVRLNASQMGVFGAFRQVVGGERLSIRTVPPVSGRPNDYPFRAVNLYFDGTVLMADCLSVAAETAGGCGCPIRVFHDGALVRAAGLGLVLTPQKPEDALHTYWAGGRGQEPFPNPALVAQDSWTCSMFYGDPQKEYRPRAPLPGCLPGVTVSDKDAFPD